MKIFVVIFGVVVGSILLWAIRMGPQKIVESTPQQYICPMHPQVVSERPGSCPVCGMDLVLATGKGHDHGEDDALGDHGDVNFSLKKQQMIGIVTARVEKKNLFKSIRLPGRAAFDPELYTAQSEYLNALKQWHRVKNSPSRSVLENTRQMIRSSEIRLKVLGLSEGQIQDLKKKGRQTEGLLVSGRGQDNWIYADVFEMDLPWMKQGLEAEITGSALQGKVIKGEVISVDRVINPRTRTAKVRIRIVSEGIFLRPESYVNVTIFTPLGLQTAIPVEAVMDTGREAFVFVKKDEGEFIPRKISILLETDKSVAVTRGVEPGEEVVVGGNFMLDSESRLKAIHP